MQKLQKMVNKKELITFACLSLVLLLLMTVCPTFAEVKGADTVKKILTDMVGIIGMVFVAAGVVLAAYSVGQLAMALKNEDADSKSRASTQLVVAVVLISLPTIIDGLNLLDYIK